MTQHNELPEDKNEKLVLAMFKGADEAEAAVEGLKQWDRINEHIKLGQIGVLTRDANGKVKANIGRKAGKGAAIGVGVGALAAVLTGGVALVGGMLTGALLGGGVGSLFKRSLGLSEADLSAISERLTEGGAVVAVMCDDYEVANVTEYLVASHGDVHAFDMSSSALAETAAAVNEAAGSATAVADSIQEQE